MQVGVITCLQFATLTKDDEILKNELLKRGIVVTCVVWNDNKVVWSSFSLIIIRSPW